MDDDALEKFIDTRIPRELRENYAREVAMIRAGWNACQRHYEQNKPADPKNETDHQG